MAQANNDPIFDEDVAPDEEPLEWEATDEGIEISLDCTKCAAYTPFTITWEEILALGAGRKVANFSRVGSALHYRYCCNHCVSNYRSAEYSDKDAKREATSTLIISVAEFDAWHRQAVGRARASGKNLPQMQQQPQVQPQQQQPQVQPQQQPVQQQAPPAPRQQVQQQPRQVQARPRVQLTHQDKESIRQYVRQMAQQGYNKPQIIEARRAYAKKLLRTRREEAAIQQAQQQQAQQPQQRQVRRRAPQPQQPPTPVVQQAAKFRKMRTRDGRVVLVDAAGRIVKYLT